MGRFIISRTVTGDRFLLQSDVGRALAVSRDYATLDACKKGICSLVYYAPIVPIVDASLGEYGPNPKFEITADEDGALYYALKSANGKSVVNAGPYATKKACLRAIAMLRTGVQGASVYFDRPAGMEKLTVGGLVQDPAPQAAPMPDVEMPAEAAQESPVEALVAAEAPATVATSVHQPTPAAEVKKPHRIPTAAPARKPSAPQKKKQPEKPAQKGLLARLFKR